MPIESIIASFILSHVSDSMKNDKILTTEAGTQVRRLVLNIREIQKYRDVFALNDDNIFIWYIDIKDAMYDGIDILDMYIMAIQTGYTATWKDRLNSLLYTLSVHQVNIKNNSMAMLRAIELSNKKIEALLEMSKNFEKLSNLDDYRNLMPTVTTTPGRDSDHENVMLGRNEKENIILKKLKEDYTHLTRSMFRVLPIVGMGGMGKTTLAQSVFGKEKERFGISGWVDVAESSDAEELLRKVAYKFGLRPFENADLGDLTTCVANHVKDRKFLLVLDNVWTTDQHLWGALLSPLSWGQTGSWLIITTRDKGVVQTINICTPGLVEPQIELSGLNDEIIWEIVKQHAFDEFNPGKHAHLEERGKRIVKKLHGSPLAAKAIGRVLRINLSVDDNNEHRERDWARIEETDFWKLWQGNQEKHLVPALILSFLHLTPRAKPCFTYLSLFPNTNTRVNNVYGMYDPDIITEREMVYQWLAHDYFQGKDIGDIEASGEKILKHLQSMCLLNKDAFKWEYDAIGDRYVPSTMMHDLIYDTSRASGMDDHIQISEHGSLDDVNLCEDRLRHLYMSCLITVELLSSLENCKKLRTLILFNKRERRDLKNFHIKLLQSLRVLILREFDVGDLVHEIGKLKHLRYLELSSLTNQTLPIVQDTFAQLAHLQVLIIRQLTESTYEFLGKLVRLRYLDLSSNDMETLPDCMTGLSDLRVLILSYCENLKRLPNGIDNLKHLEVLNLYDCKSMTELPAGLGSLSQLRELDLADCDSLRVPCQLKDLHNLRRLRIMGFPSSITGIKELTSLETLEEFRVHEDTHNITDLQNLNMLGGKLMIYRLENVSSQGEAKLAKLQQKGNLKELELSWSVIYNMRVLKRKREIDLAHAEEVLEGLKPNECLQKLTIEYYIGRRPPSWASGKSLRFLKQLIVKNCRQLRFLFFVGLQSSIPRCSTSQQVEGNALFLFLEDLSLDTLLLLEAFQGPNDSARNECLFPRLKRIIVRHCPELRYLPLLPSSLESVDISKTGLVEFLDRRNLSTVSDVGLLRNLRHLSIAACSGLEAESLGKSLQALTSLQTLSLINCCPVSNPFFEAALASKIQTTGHFEFTDNDNAFCMVITENREAYLHWDYRKSNDHTREDICSRVELLTRILVCLGSSRIEKLIISEARYLILVNDSPLGQSFHKLIEPDTRVILYQGVRSLKGFADCRNTHRSIKTGLFSIHGCQNIRSLDGGILSYPLPQVTELVIEDCVNLEVLPKRGFAKLSSLRRLELTNCPKIRAISSEDGSYPLPPSLNILKIKHCCKDFDVDPSFRDLPVFEFLPNDDEAYDPMDTSN